MEALLIEEKNSLARVLCPYCKKIHKHGYLGDSTIIGAYRTSDCETCKRGEYKIVGAVNAFGSLHSAIGRLRGSK